MEPVSHLLAIVISLGLSAFFSGSETALLRLRPEEIEEDAAQRPGPAVLAARDLVSSSSRLLVTILLGNNIVNIFAASVAASLAIYYLGERLGIAVSTIALTLVILIVSEIMPKALAASHARRVSYFVALPLYLIHKALYPVHLLFDNFIDPLVTRILGPAPAETPSSTESLLKMAREIPVYSGSGSPMPIIGSAAKAAETTAGEIMTPRAEMVAFPITMRMEELLDQMLEERYTRVPVYEGSIDTILGCVHLKEVMKLVRARSNDLHSILTPVLRVPERRPILTILADMQRAMIHVAIVKDEFGITLGMLTQEDILEELVGEIRDEYDMEELSAVQHIDADTCLVLARVPVVDLNRETGWEVPGERGDTIGGLVFNHLGRSPRLGDQVTLGEYEAVVVELSGPRLVRIRVTRTTPPSDDTTGD